MVNFPSFGAKAHEDDLQVAQAEAPRFEYVDWKKEPHLRKLYALSLVLMLGSATTGYDGYGHTKPPCDLWLDDFFREANTPDRMLVNTSQQLDYWTEFFSPEIEDENWLGLLINMFNIGSIVSFFIT